MPILSVPVLVWQLTVVPLLLYTVYCLLGFLSKMFLSLIGICTFLYLLFYLICVLIFDCDITLGFVEKFGKKISSLKGKVVFITGASSGIGEFTAISLAKEGVKLVLAARRKDELERVKASCLANSNGKLKDEDILVLQMDVLNFDMHQQYFNEALQHFGQIDIVLNNAGRSQRANWENIKLSVDREMFDLNVFAVINFSRIAVKYFLERNEGHIAVTSSVAGIVGAPYSASYTASKHAIHGYFNSLRTEKIPNNLTVTVLCPGPVYTNFLSECFMESSGEKFGQQASPNDRRMSAERCGHLCAVALANQLKESWMGILPLIPFLYIAIYAPVVYSMLLKIVGPQTLYKIRDSKGEFKSEANH